MKDMQPLGRGIVADNAKALLLKDTDYSTPSDHYFAHLQKLKTELESSKDKDVLQGLNVDLTELEQAI